MMRFDNADEKEDFTFIVSLLFNIMFSREYIYTCEVWLTLNFASIYIVFVGCFNYALVIFSVLRNNTDFIMFLK